MRAIVVYDSFFGNTEKIALAIGKALGSDKTIKVIKVDAVEMNMLDGIENLVVGSPTRAFSPTPAIKSFLKKIPANKLAGVKVAAFDTRLPMNEGVPGFLRFMVKVFGYADKPIMDQLLKKGGKSALPSEGFFVSESEGPLAEGELARAEEWGKKIKAE